MGRSRTRSRSRDKRSEEGLRRRSLTGKRSKRPCYWDMTPAQAMAIGLPLERMQAQVPSQIGSDQNKCKIYVGFGNHPVTPKEHELRQFFNATMIAAQGVERKPGDSVIGVSINPERPYGFISFRNIEEAEQSLSLDGIAYRGQPLRLARASHAGGNAPTRAAMPVNVKPLDVTQFKIMSTNVQDGPNKIYIGGLPSALNSMQIQELLQTYGPLQAFYLFSDNVTGVSKGYAFANYRNPTVTQTAIRGLNGLQVGDRRIVVKRADSGGPLSNPVRVMSDLGLGRQDTVPPSEVVCFLQMVTEADLIDENEYKGIIEDIREEAEKFGVVHNIVIPRNIPGKKVSGVGKVFVAMGTIDAATKVKTALEGRQFLGRTVLATFYSKQKFIASEL